MHKSASPFITLLAGVSDNVYSSEGGEISRSIPAARYHPDASIILALLKLIITYL
jgi:hypothetical protein